MKIGICVGNGLSIDLQKKYEHKLKNFDTHSFLGWNVKTPGSSSLLIDSLPKLKNALKKIEPKKDDFQVVEDLLKMCSSPLTYDNGMLLLQLQHYICLAFSTYQKSVDNINIKDWRWVKWLQKIEGELLFAISFNYDKVLENLLSAAGKQYRRIGIKNEQNGVRILKPHGSIDFEIAEGCISMPAVTYPPKNAICRNNCEIEALPSDDLLKARKEVDIVLPNEYSTQLTYQWVKPGYDILKSNGHIFTHFIFIGLSYCKFDRAEIDFIINSLNPESEIIVVGPNPNPLFIKKLDEKFSNIKLWKNGPEVL